MAKTALVTGASGFNGTHLCEALLEKGYQVIGTDLQNTDRRYLDRRVKFMPSDITDIDSLKPLVKEVDVVFHSASILDYNTPMDWIRRINVYGTENLCKVSLEANVKRMVVWSSYTVYGNWHPSTEILTESSPKVPRTFYEKSKWYQEQIAFRYTKLGLPCTTIRPAPMYGSKNAYGIASFFFLVAPFSVVPIPLTFTNLIPSVHIKDVAHAAIFLSENDNAIGKAFNIVDDYRVTLKETLEFLAPHLGYITIPTLIPAKHLISLATGITEMGDPKMTLGKRREAMNKHIKYLLRVNQVMSNQRLKDLGYQLQYPDPKSGIIETIRWYYDHGWLKENKLYFYINKLTSGKSA